MNRVALVGAGCGAHTLTLRGRELLARCDCVVYDSLADARLLRLCRAGCEAVFVGKRAGAHAMEQAEICRLLAACAQKYPLTVRLKGGDPFVFGRGGEEMLALRAAGVPCECVPGVTSAVAAAEEAGIPLTHRGLARGFRVVTARTAEGEYDFSALGRERDTLVVLMGKGSAASVAAGLMRGGMAAKTPAAAVSCAGSARFAVRRGALGGLAALAEGLPAPLVLVVGAVCALDVRTPARARVAVTGTPAHVARLCEALRAEGLWPLACPHLRIEPRDLRPFFARLHEFAWLVFTSPNGVEQFFAQAKARRVDFRAFAGKKFACIGPATAEALAGQGFAADLVPREHTSAGLAAALRPAAGERAALLRSAKGSGALLPLGEQFDVYDAVPDEAGLAEAAEAARGADFITFSSAFGARAFLRGASLGGARPVCIGQETASAFAGGALVCAEPSAAALAAFVRAAAEGRA